MQSEELLIRAMQYDDLDAVSQLENLSYEFPWTRGIFQDCLRVGYRCDVLVNSKQRVVGYCIVSMAAGEAHILNLCVLPELRNQGIGRLLLEHLLGCAQQCQCQRIFLEVRPSNVAALALYESNGFARIGLRRDYYQAQGGKEDAIVLGLTLNQRDFAPD